MEFVLYDIFLNVFQVDEAYEAHAKIENRFILISTPGDKFRNFQDDKFLFDFYRDKTYKSYSKEKVNTRIRVFSNTEPEKFNDYYAHLSYSDYFRLLARFNRLWIQQKENLMWITNLFVALSAILLSTYVTVKLSKSNSPQKVEIVTPIRIEDRQIIDLNELVKNNKSLDSIFKNTSKKEKVKIILEKEQLDYIIRTIKNSNKGLKSKK